MNSSRKIHHIRFAVTCLAATFPFALAAGPSVNDLLRIYEGGYGDYRRFAEVYGKLDTLAQHGSADAQAWRGYLRLMGDGTSEDHAGGIADLETAAKKGSSDGDCLLARIHAGLLGGVPDVQLARQRYQKAAEAGDPIGWFGLAWLTEFYPGPHETEDTVRKWYANALAGFERLRTEGSWRGYSGLLSYYSAAEQNPAKLKKVVEEMRASGSVRAFLLLSKIETLGPSPNYLASSRFAQSGQEAGNRTCMTQLAWLYREGLHPEGKDLKKALQWAQRAAEAGDSEGMAIIADYYAPVAGEPWVSWNAVVGGSDAAKSVRSYEKAANKGSSLAMVRLGILYREGLHPKGRDLKKALEWFRKAAHCGNADGVAELANHYAPFPGEFFESRNKLVGGADAAKAVRLYEKASGLGNANANAKLGYAFRDAIHPDGLDLKKAFDWFQKAANADDAEGLAEFANYYAPFEGEIWEHRHAIAGGSNAAKAAELYEKAAKLGNSFAMTKLAYLFRDGAYPKGVDLKKALDWFQKAADAGDADAMSQVANYYAPFEGEFWVSRNKIVGGADARKAAKLYEKAAGLGSSFAMSKLGFLYWNGQHPEGRNPSAAKQWFTKAAKAGEEEAQEVLDAMNAR